MKFQEEYKAYLSELSEHLFDDKKISEIIQNTHLSHRKKRFVVLYLARDKETFDSYYAKRKSLGLESIFSQLIAGLLYETDKHVVKRAMVSTLKLTEEMIEQPVEEHEKKEVNKDLNSFLFYLRKQKNGYRLKKPFSK